MSQNNASQPVWSKEIPKGLTGVEKRTGEDADRGFFENAEGLVYYFVGVSINLTENEQIARGPFLSIEDAKADFEKDTTAEITEFLGLPDDGSFARRVEGVDKVAEFLKGKKSLAGLLAIAALASGRSPLGGDREKRRPGFHPGLGAAYGKPREYEKKDTIHETIYGAGDSPFSSQFGSTYESLKPQKADFEKVPEDDRILVHKPGVCGRFWHFDMVPDSGMIVGEFLTVEDAIRSANEYARVADLMFKPEPSPAAAKESIREDREIQSRMQVPQWWNEGEPGYPDIETVKPIGDNRYAFAKNGDIYGVGQLSAIYGPFRSVQAAHRGIFEERIRNMAKVVADARADDAPDLPEVTTARKAKMTQVPPGFIQLTRVIKEIASEWAVEAIAISSYRRVRPEELDTPFYTPFAKENVKTAVAVEGKEYFVTEEYETIEGELNFLISHQAAEAKHTLAMFTGANGHTVLLDPLKVSRVEAKSNCRREFPMMRLRVEGKTVTVQGSYREVVKRLKKSGVVLV